MISVFGSSLLFLSFLFSIFGLIIIIIGRFFKNKTIAYIHSGSNAFLCSSTIILIGLLTLLTQILSNNFDLKFVANVSSISTPVIYKIGALWAGAEGSLLLWCAIISVYIIYFIISYKKRYPEIFSTALIIIGCIYTCFLGFLFFLNNPFEPVITQLDGSGTTPSLQNILMLIHPPMLYSGYIGFLIPFSMTLASLIENKNNSQYIESNRRNVLFAWLILTVAIILGGRWAYLELGWGGYWAWDPVENASLMPWLVSTAYLHSILVEQKKGILRLWNIILISLTYWLTILGVYLVRSGVIQESVHSFAESSIGMWLLVLSFIILIFSVVTILLKLKSARPKEKIESFASREAGFLYNNVLFIGLMVFILFALFQPIFYKIIWGETTILVDANGYNGIAILFGCLLLFLMGIAPFLSWRKTSKKILKKIFFIPLMISLISFALCFLISALSRDFSESDLATIINDLTLSIYVMLIVFVAYGIFDEFIKATYLRYKNKNENLFFAFLQLFKINRSRYGGYIVHLGFLMMTIGFIGKAFDIKEDHQINIKEKLSNSEKLFIRSTQIDDYIISVNENYIEKSSKISESDLIHRLMQKEEIKLLDQKKAFKIFKELISKNIKNNESRSNHFSEIVILDIKEKNQESEPLTVERRFYFSPSEITKEIALKSNLIKDLYIILNRIDYNTNTIYITVWVNYLVNWVWIGTVVILIGGLISLNPFKRIYKIRNKS